MTEPDEAILWAREDYARQRLERGHSDSKYEAELIRDGAIDPWTSVSVRARAYRAGQAASAERIKALEEALRKQIALHNSPILNQHLIDAARLEGIRLGLEAAWHQISGHGFEQDMHMGLDPTTIAREAVLDKLASEAQEQGMGYEKEADQ